VHRLQHIDDLVGRAAIQIVDIQHDPIEPGDLLRWNSSVSLRREANELFMVENDGSCSAALPKRL
jgi:hypothetical protein